ncbi:hypothetical protein [Alcaligenes sp. Marseille-Q7550]
MQHEDSFIFKQSWTQIKSRRPRLDRIPARPLAGGTAASSEKNSNTCFNLFYFNDVNIIQASFQRIIVLVQAHFCKPARQADPSCFTLIFPIYFFAFFI